MLLALATSTATRLCSQALPEAGAVVCERICACVCVSVPAWLTLAGWLAACVCLPVCVRLKE